MFRAPSVRALNRSASPWFLTVALLLAALATPPAAQPAPSVVWLVFHEEGKQERATIEAPLAWMAAMVEDDEDSDGTIEIDGRRYDVRQLWETHKGLPIGEKRVVDRGVDKDGDNVVLQVHGRAPSAKAAEGKMRIRTKDPEGKVTDVRLPLDIPDFLLNLLDDLNLKIEKRDRSGTEEIEIPIADHLKKLGDYGPFVLFEGMEEGTRVNVAIE